MDERCPICRAATALNWAVQWDNGEPAPNSATHGYMSTCKPCHDGVYGLITPWEWVRTCLRQERENNKEVRALLHRISLEVNAVKQRV